MIQRPKTFVLLLRGINVGGKNKIGMAELKKRLEEEGFEGVLTHSLAGNVVLRSSLSAAALSAKIEGLLKAWFKLDSELVMVVAIDRAAFEKVVAEAPSEFGADDGGYRYYVLFLKDRSAREAMKDIEVRPEIDKAWPGPSVVYFRLPSLTSPHRSKSWLNRITQKPIYQVVTMRNWATTRKIAEILRKNAAAG
jgi:uncharacterized protein (DUF1697 family)